MNPDSDIKLLTVPAAQTVANMKTGTMDAFSTGDQPSQGGVRGGR